MEAELSWTYAGFTSVQFAHLAFPISFVQTSSKSGSYHFWSITRYLFHVFTLKTHNLDTFCCWLKFWPPKDFGKTNHLPKRIWIQNTKKTKLSNWQKLQIYSAYFKLVKICVVLKHVLMTVGALSACLLCVAFGKLFVKLAQWENPKHALMGNF